MDVQLAGPDLDRLPAAAEDVKRWLRAYAGVYEVTDSFRAGKEEMKLGIRPAAENLGLTLQDLGRQVPRRSTARRRSGSSAAATTSASWSAFRATSAARSLGDLENMRIRTSDGGERGALQPSRRRRAGRGFASIRRVDRNRVVNGGVDERADRTGDGDGGGARRGRT